MSRETAQLQSFLTADRVRLAMIGAPRSAILSSKAFTSRFAMS